MSRLFSTYFDEQAEGMSVLPVKVTIKTIAADLGVSHMTVSRVLSGKQNVKPELRDRILNRAKELGYVKNTAALTMRGEKPAIVGLLVPNIRNEFYAHFADALTNACNEKEINLLIHLTHDDITKEERALTLLKEAQAHSVIMVPSPTPTNYQPNHSGLNIIEFIRTRNTQAETCHLLINEEPAIDAAISRLVNLGHEKFAYIGADNRLASGQRRQDFFQNSIKKHGVPSEQVNTFTGLPNFDYGYTTALDIVQNIPETTAILCGGFNISLGALNALLQSDGYSFKERAFIGYGDSTFYRWLGGGISTISLPLDQLAKSAVELLSGFQKDEIVGPQSYIHPASLTVR